MGVLNEITQFDLVNILKDYHWMMNSIKLLRDSMVEAGERVVRTYDIDSDMPKAKGGTSDPVFQEYLRRDKRWKKILEYEAKVQIIQKRIHVISDEREAEVLHWMLEGKSFRWIALHMGLSPSHINRLRLNIVEQLVSYGANGTNGTDGTNFHDNKKVL
jgi:DNA-directed RNA polymerase specialized sigma subunit